MSRGWQEIPLPDGMNPRLMLWHFFADNYHWTPDQVEEAPLEVQDWFPVVKKAMHEAQSRIAKQDAQSNRAGPRR